MRLESFSTSAFLAGLVALAAALFFLQRLRVRHREVPVVTTLFWREAVEETRARVLVHRFRHPWAYLLVLAISSLLWLAAAGPRARSGGERDYLLLLDGSAGMAHAERFDQALGELRRTVGSLPRDRRLVVFCGATEQTLLRPGEEELLLEPRLAGLAPAAAPASIEDALARHARSHAGDQPVTALVFGDAPLRSERAALLPASWTVRRATAFEDGRAGNRGITGLGVSQARSGAWSRVDLFVELRGPALAAEPAVSLSVGGQPFEALPELERSTGRTRLVWRDLPAGGALARVALERRGALPPDAFALDDAAEIALPDRPAIRVALSPTVEAALGDALAADPAVRLVEGEADVAVRRAGEVVGAGLPALELVPEGAQEEALLFFHPPADDSHAVLIDAVQRLGFSRADAADAAERSGRAIAVGATPAPSPARGVGMWEALLDPELGFTESRSFPLLVAGAVRWLAGVEPFAPFVAAGEPVAAGGRWQVEGGAQLDTVGAPFTPPRAGRYADAEGRVLAAALLDPWSTAGGDPGLVEPPAAGELEDGGGSELVTLLGLVALAALAVEWLLVRSGRMP